MPSGLPTRSDRLSPGPHASVDGRSAAHLTRSAPLSGLSGTPPAHRCSDVRARSTHDRPPWPVVPPLNPAQRVSRPSGRLRTACQPAHADRPGTPGTRAPAPRSVPGGRPPRDDPQPSAHIPPMSGEFRTGRWDPSADKTRGTWGTGIGGTRQYEATRSPAIEEWLRR